MGDDGIKLLGRQVQSVRDPKEHFAPAFEQGMYARVCMKRAFCGATKLRQVSQNFLAEWRTEHLGVEVLLRVEMLLYRRG